MPARNSTAFTEQFNLAKSNLGNLFIRETQAKDNCYLIDNKGITYDGFIVVDKPSVKTLCKLTFYPSSLTGKYVPRLEFRKVKNDGTVKESRGSDVIIGFTHKDEAINFWELINFLKGFGDLIDSEDFDKEFNTSESGASTIQLESEMEKKHIEELIELTKNARLSNLQLKQIIANQRRRAVYGFYCLLKNYVVMDEDPFSYFRRTRKINQLGEEVIWQNFLLENKWILGLNTRLEFIKDLLPEKKTGKEDSSGAGSPKQDFYGLSYFTTLIELKTAKTEIFKSKKAGGSRANTWDFSTQFIEAYSQTLGQKFALEKDKEIVHDGEVVDNYKNRVLDPRAVLIIGSRNDEFPHDRSSEHLIKSDTFERIRRDIRNIEILTFDELFERAFHIVYTKPLPDDWFNMDPTAFTSRVLEYNPTIGNK